ncbi:MAG: heavy metal-responsive transcriptional regulator [Cyanobacteria bacterium P01_G01_bin.54]
MTTTTGLKIGALANQTGVAVGALRYYEERGLLQSERGRNGYRYYPETAVQQVQFIKKAQALGFALEDIGKILMIHQQGNLPCEQVRSLLQAKIEQLERQIQQTIAFKTELEQYRDHWAAFTPDQPGEICPLIETVPLGRVIS